MGKTFLIEEFARREFDGYVRVDFLRDGQAAYVANAVDARDLVGRLSLMAGHGVDPGRTLVFFDEVQEAQNLVTLSKHLVEDGRFRIVVSGSPLGVGLIHAKSLPVGFLHAERMLPLDFEEFGRAVGLTQAMWSSLGEHLSTPEPIEASLHERLVRLFRLFIVVGGMPAAVQAYVDGRGDLGAARDTQRDLVQLYRADISRCADGRVLQAMSIFDSIPSQLDKENKRFELRTLRRKATFERYASDFRRLVSSCAALKTVNVSEPACPLKRTEEPGRFKLCQSDTGMLSSRYPLDVAMAAINGQKDVSFGGVYERVLPRSWRRRAYPCATTGTADAARWTSLQRPPGDMWCPSR